MPLVRSLNAACLLVPLLAMPAYAADSPPNLDEVCARTACRTGGYRAVVGVDATQFREVQVNRSPYILENGAILLFPGETVAVTFAVDGDTLGRPVSATRMAPGLPLMIADKDNKPVPNPDDAALPAVNGKLPADQVATLSPNTILISYGQLQRLGGSGMQLTSEHNLAHMVKFDAIVAEFAGDSYRQHPTSSCPVMPKIVGMENWPNPLGPIVLTRFRFVEQGNSMVCD
jgi:hypothetical protein